MRIIKPGFKEATPDKEEECRHCGCVFAYTLSDIKRFTNSGIPFGEPYVSCPHCNVVIHVVTWQLSGKIELLGKLLKELSELTK